MLKPFDVLVEKVIEKAATFGWLCVETAAITIPCSSVLAATFGWLCVETLNHTTLNIIIKAATFGWLCVETALFCVEGSD